jgi:hypothetical protein
MDAKASFILGISKKAEELSLPAYLKEHILKYANVLWTNDTIEDIAGKGPNVGDSDGPGLLSLVSKHVGKASLAGGALGGSLGGLAGNNISDKNKTRNTVLGGGVGALVGGTTSAINDLYRLIDNSRVKEINSIKEQMNSGQLPEHLGNKYLEQIDNTPWYKFYEL